MTGTRVPPFWRERLLVVVGAPPTPENLRLLTAWATAEGGNARWNPLNTTLRLHGSSDYNTAGVQSYERATEGVCALALTLVNGHYGRLLGALQAGKLAAEGIVDACRADIVTWGTDPDVILRVLAGMKAS